jgi:hypothetical protein
MPLIENGIDAVLLRLIRKKSEIDCAARDCGSLLALLSKGRP